MRKLLAATVAALPLLSHGAMAEEAAIYDVKGAYASMANSSYAPIGIRMPWNFVAHPMLNVKEQYDSNVYRKDSQIKSDFITRIQPGIVLNSDWANHEFNFEASGDIAKHQDLTRENTTDARVAADGRLDVVRGSYFTGAASYNKLHEYRGSPNDVRGDKPTTYSLRTGEVGYMHELGRVKLSGDVKVDDYNFSNNRRGAFILRNYDRDRTQAYYTGKVAYEFHPDYNAFVRYTYNTRSFDRNTPQYSDSTGNAYALGTDIDISGTLKGEAYAGYYTQNYDKNFDSLGYFNYGGKLLWSLSPINSIEASVLRELQPTVIRNASDYLETSYGLRWNYAPRDNLLLNLRGIYANDDFYGTAGGKNRTDDIYRAGLGADYMIARGLAAQADYDYIQRQSSANGADYDDSLVTLGLRYSF